MSIEDVKALCVTNFPTSRSRPAIMEGLEKALRLLHDHNISAEVWLDGSFMTKKIDPADVDIILSINGEIFEKGSEKIKSVVMLFNDTSDLKSFFCHSYILIMYPNSNDATLRDGSTEDHNYWLELFGTSRGNDEKGINSSPGVEKGMALITTPFKEDTIVRG